MKEGKFIALEGGEGTGKSTQARLLAEKLRACGLMVTQTREPGGTVAGEAIRDLLLGEVLATATPLTEALLFSAARAEHIDKRILPSLADGSWVISDRFIDSMRAYQGLEGGLSSDTLDALEKIVVGDRVPDLTILLDMPAEAGLQRAAMRHEGTFGADQTRDRFEAREIAFHEALRQRFLEIANSGRRRYEIVDASQEEETVHDEIWNAVQQRLMD